jgi:hypothetical protein
MWTAFVPTYRCGTVPDLHRVPSFVADRQNHAKLGVRCTGLPEGCERRMPGVDVVLAADQRTGSDPSLSSSLPDVGLSRDVSASHNLPRRSEVPVAARKALPAVTKEGRKKASPAQASIDRCAPVLTKKGVAVAFPLPAAQNRSLMALRISVIRGDRRPAETVAVPRLSSRELPPPCRTFRSSRSSPCWAILWLPIPRST